MGSFGNGPTRGVLRGLLQRQPAPGGRRRPGRGGGASARCRASRSRGGRAKVDFTVAEDLPMTRRRRRRSATSTSSATATSRSRRASPAPPRSSPAARSPRPHDAGAQPDRALQRLRPAVLGARPRGGQRALAQPDQGAPGGGRHRSRDSAQTASLTSAIANRDQLVGQMIDNLNETPRHRGQPPRAGDPAHHRAASLGRGTGRGPGPDRSLGREHRRLTSMLADLVPTAAPASRRTSPSCAGWPRCSRMPTPGTSSTPSSPTCPRCSADQTRTGTYGSWYNYYVCGANANIQLPAPLSRSCPCCADRPKNCGPIQAQVRHRAVLQVRGRSDFQIDRIGSSHRDRDLLWPRR